MKFGLPLSIGAHGAVIGATWLGFGFGKSQINEYQIIPVKILTLSSETNVRPASVEPENEAKVESEVAPEFQLVPKSDAEPEVALKSAPATVLKSETVKPDPVEKLPFKAKNVEPPTPKPAKPKPLSLDDLSALVEQSKEKMDTGEGASAGQARSQTLLESERNQIEQAEQSRLSAGRGDGMTTAYTDAIMRRIYNSWKIPSGAPNLESLVINVDVTLDRNGRVMTSKLSRDSQRLAASDEFYRIAAESAIRAVQDAAEFKFLPRNEYERWSTLSLTFLPKDAPTGVPT